MTKKVRVRFAPSPTGPLHMGGVRTALYNYLFAKKHGGDFLLRIEDTDQTRFVPGAEQYIVDALKWCGIEPNEGLGYGGEFGPYRQSERKPMYRQYAEQLIANGSAYYAFDTAEELDLMRDQAKQAKMPNWQYSSITRNSMKNSLTLPEEEVKQRLANGEPYVIRFKMPRNEEVRFHDEIRSWVVVNTNNVDDKVLFKSDGMPTYHLANIVDDYLMKITHVIRGEEWLPSAPLHVLLYRGFGWEESMPKFAHLPLILKPDGNGKLSKRDGDRLGFPVFPLEWRDPETGAISSGYREQGYFPEAFLNTLVMLGWNPGTTQELFSLDEMAEQFSLSRVGKSGAKFDPDKTKWYNQQYLRAKSPMDLAADLQPLLKAAGIEVSDDYAAGVCALMSERASFIPELMSAEYFFKAPQTYDEKTVSKKWNAESASTLQALADQFRLLDEFSAEEIDRVFHAFMNDNKMGFGQLGPIFRLVLTGVGMGPALPAIAALLGKEESLRRMEAGIKTLG